jgi:predicted TIM-barrel fold metal-dependent hydrolase
MTSSGCVDAHHHIWRQEDLAWLKGPMVPRIFGPYASIRRDYSIDEYRADVTPSGITQSVYVQTNWPLDKTVEEVRWVQQVADETGWPHAIVGSADMFDEGCPRVFAEQARISRLMRGTRQQLHWHRNPAYRFAPAPDTMNDPVFRRNLARIEDYGWHFELQVFSGQMRDAASLVAAYPAIPFVLVHAGMLESDLPEDRDAWEEGMKRLADQPNVVVKLSGLGTFLHRVDHPFIAQIVRDSMALFGSERCMFGSNFPIEKIWSDFATLWGTYAEVLGNFPGTDRNNVLRETAIRVYRLAG